MVIKENITAVRQFWEGFNTHNLEVWDEVCARDFVNHDPGLPTPEADLATIKQTVGELLAAFPDMGSSEEDLVVEGNKVMVRRILRGRHRGVFLGIAPTDKEVVVGGVWIAHLSGGQIKEQWVFFDALGLLRQIGGISESKARGG
jgi:predicted ester cyclase